MLSPLLATKLYIPPARPNRVPRPRLIEQLNIFRPLTLISAPAGSGKTTALSEWIPSSQHCVTWLSLDDGDNEPTRFWIYVIAALQTLRADLGEGSMSLLQLPQPPPIVSILTTLLNEVASFPEHFALVLDDYHLIKSRAIHEALTFLIDHLPPNMRVILATRADPPLRIARLRARNQMTELRADDLRFTSDEVAVFLNDVMRLKLTAENITALELRTEGWVAGLQLAALSMQGREDVSGFIQAFSGSHRHLLSYLMEEVLDRRPEGTLDFLLQTSILDRLCGPLCDAVTGESVGQVLLQKLEQANLFIVPLDNEGKWYRYHHLFAEVLRARLQQTQPNLITILHIRASAWYEQNGLIAESIGHSMTAGDFDSSARLLEQSAWQLLGRGELNTLQTLLDRLPVEMVQVRPHLSLAYATIFSITNQMDALASRLDEAERALAHDLAGSNVLLPSDRDILLGQVAALRAHLARERNDWPQGLILCRQALTLIPADNLQLRCVVTYFLAHAQRLSGDTAAAIQTFTESSRLGRATNNPLFVFYALRHKAGLEKKQGHLHQAVRTCQDALQLAAEKSWLALPMVGLVYISLGELLREWNELESAKCNFQKGLELGQLGSHRNLDITANLGLATVHQAQGNSDHARVFLAQAAQIARVWNRAAPISQVAVAEAQLALAQGDVESASRWASASDLRADEAELPLAREPEYLVLARVLIAENQTPQAARLLDTLWRRAEAGELTGSAVETLVLRTLLFWAQGNVTEAAMALEHALTLAESEGYIRIFVDEGEPMREVIGHWRLETSRHKNLPELQTRLMAYADKLLEAFPNHASQLINTNAIANSPVLRAPLVEPLSARELEVLNLIAAGASNQDIARELTVALNTVKKHSSNLFFKLGVTSRTQAVARGRELQLI